MSETIGTAYIQIEPSADGISGSIEGVLNKEAGGAGKKAGAAFSSALGTTLKAGGAVAAAGASITAGLVKSATDSFGEYEQLVGGVETLFGDSADKVLNNADKAFKTAGLSANDYMETVTSFTASLLQSLDGDTNAAADSADQALKDMADNANKMGTSMESIQNAYQGFAKQNYTMLDNLKLGYGGTKSEMERLLADAKELTGQDYNIDNLSDVYNAIHAIQDELGITGTTAKEASTTIQGSAASMAASWQNMLVAISSGEGMDQAMDGLVGSVQDFIGNIIPVIEQSLTGIGDLVKGLAPILTEQLPVLIDNVLPGLLEAGVELVRTLLETLVSTIPTLLPEIVEIIMQITEMLVSLIPDLISGLIDGLIAALPILIGMLPELITQIANALITSIPVLIQGIAQLITMLAQSLPELIISLIEALPDLIQQICDAIVENLPLLIDAAVTLITELVIALPDIVMALVKAIPQIIVSIVEAIVKCAPKFIEAAGKLLEAFKKGFEKMKEVGKNIIEGLWNGINNAKDWLISKIKSFCSSALGAIKDFFGIHSPSKLLADEVGKFLPAGIAVGIDANADSAIEAMDRLGTSMNATLSSDLETIGTDAKYGISITEPGRNDSLLYDMLAEYLPQIAQGNSITLEGDMKKMFRAVKKQNDIYRKSNGRSAFA